MLLLRVALGIVLTSGLWAKSEQGEAVSPPPNIVLIIADDLAWDDSGPYGHPSLQTPHLSRLAAEGMLFENAFLTASSCSPSRCSLITGRYPHQTGAEELHWPLPKEQTTFVEKLKTAGYWTAAAGKWHLGDAVKDRFDVVRETDTSGFQLPSGDAAKDGKFIETMEGEAQSGCIDWVPLLKERPQDQPFFLWLAALDPHRPYHEGIIADPTDPATVRLPPYHLDTPEVRRDFALYYDEVIRLDKYVGMVLEELDAQGISENTLVIFISDNGRPFPRDKTTIYDSGIRTPCLVRWPQVVPKGVVTSSLLSAIDFASTFLDVAGVEDPGPTFQGTSLLPIFKNSKAVVRDVVFAEQNWHDYEAHGRAVRDERFKYIRNSYPDLPLTPSADGVRSRTFQQMIELHKEGKLTTAQTVYFEVPRPAEELYDCVADPYEIENLASQEEFKEDKERLSKRLDDWVKATGDSVPELRTADEFDRLTGLPTPARVRPRLSKAEMVAKGLVAP
ncbi:MAG: sulfatase family protein [Roseibacillus sp.]